MPGPGDISAVANVEGWHTPAFARGVRDNVIGEVGSAGRANRRTGGARARADAVGFRTVQSADHVQRDHHDGQRFGGARHPRAAPRVDQRA